MTWKTFSTYQSPLLDPNGAPLHHGDGEPVYWLDRLLNGGIRVPPKDQGPLVVLLAGSPGAGKSLLLQQILFARAKRNIDENVPQVAEAASLYICTETSPAKVIANLHQLGYESKSQDPWCLIGELLLQGVVGFNPPGKFPLMILADGGAGIVGGSGDQLADVVDRVWKRLSTVPDAPAMYPIVEIPVLAIDSLNVFPAQTRMDTLAKLRDKLSEWRWRPRILFLVLDTPTADASEWQFIADMVIRIDKESSVDQYLIRSLEIEKARFQKHAFGKHLAKIIQDPIDHGIRKLNTDEDGPRPNIREGGVFVMPGLHFVLSKLRKVEGAHSLIAPGSTTNATSNKSTSQNEAIGGVGTVGTPTVPSVGWPCAGPFKMSELNLPDTNRWTGWAPHGAGIFKGNGTRRSSYWWPVRGLFELVGGGMPLDRCVALVGPRGPGRGRIAYKFLIDAAQAGQPTVVVSFRDERDAVPGVIETICPRKDRDSKWAEPHVVFMRPGFVRAEEVFHKILTAVGEYGPTRLILNAVDNWEATHGLLAESKVFIPTLIDFLEVQKIASMIVCVTGEGSSGLAQEALFAQAAAVLEVDYKRIPWGSAKQRKTRSSKGVQSDEYPVGLPLVTHIKRGGQVQEQVLIRPIRVPNATGGLRRGVLHWAGGDDEGERAVIPLAPEFSD